MAFLAVCFELGHGPDPGWGMYAACGWEGRNMVTKTEYFYIAKDNRILSGEPISPVTYVFSLCVTNVSG